MVARQNKKGNNENINNKQTKKQQQKQSLKLGRQLIRVGSEPAI
jgi:hypothetical protein